MWPRARERGVVSGSGLPSPRPGPGQTHYRRKLAETMTPAEARRSLKRQFSNIIYKSLLLDTERCLTPTP